VSNVLQIENHKSILQASKLVWNEGCAPVRVVLRQEGEEYITHMENLRLEKGVFKHDGFYWGHYFMRLKDEAQKDFSERCAKL
jgi:hypothetical protein